MRGGGNLFQFEINKGNNKYKVILEKKYGKYVFLNKIEYFSGATPFQEGGKNALQLSNNVKIKENNSFIGIKDFVGRVKFAGYSIILIRWNTKSINLIEKYDDNKDTLIMYRISFDTSDSGCIIYSIYKSVSNSKRIDFSNLIKVESIGNLLKVNDYFETIEEFIKYLETNFSSEYEMTEIIDDVYNYYDLYKIFTILKDEGIDDYGNPKNKFIYKVFFGKSKPKVYIPDSYTITNIERYELNIGEAGETFINRTDMKLLELDDYELLYERRSFTNEDKFKKIVTSHGYQIVKEE